ncbi:MAG: hypothetical protein M3546_17205 [Actinomycetota bacterium]|nr:hypothetical protein [Actinomycetota bacterium]
MAVPDDQFETMKARARRYRARIGDVGGISVPIIEQNVRERIRGRPQNVQRLPPAQGELADEIVALLNNSELSAHQAALLKRTYFGD